MTDYGELDPIRERAKPLQLDAIEAYMDGRITRRQFVRRATVLGVSLSTLATVLAACGGDGDGGGAPPEAETGVGGSAVGDAEVQQGGTLRVASIAPANPLDPVAMIDLASYAVVAQSYEFLAYSGSDLKLTPGLAESWEPNEDGSVWTFTIRRGVKWWKDGAPLTTDDIIASFERNIEYGNSGLKGVVESGGVTAPDEQTIVFTLPRPNGNLPYLVSSDNPQTVVTPANFEQGMLVDKNLNGTGPWRMESYNQATGARFVRNDDWWGGKTPLDSVEWTFFQDLQPQIVAVQSGQADAIVQFPALAGEALLNDPNVNAIRLKSAAHQQIWMRVDRGQFTDKRVRQALALSLDREAIVQSLSQGFADIGHDHPFAAVYPFTDPSVTREQDVEQAKRLMQEAGAGRITATLHAVKLQEIPDLAVLVRNNAAEVGFDLRVAVEDASTFYARSWCPAEPKDPPCSGAEEIGIVDYGHRGVPDVYLNASLATSGAWNSAQYASDAYMQAFREYQASIGVDAQKRAAGNIERLLMEDSPTLFPYFNNYLSAHNKEFANVGVTAMGHLFLGNAGRAA